MFYLTTHSTHFIYGYMASGHGRPQVGATGGGGGGNLKKLHGKYKINKIT